MTVPHKILTISVAAYNVEDCLPRCLDSFLACKTLDLLDVIVVNDGSTDGTLEVARRYAARVPRSIRVIDKRNGGHGSTINASIGLAQGEYYKIVDADDWVVSENLDRLVEHLSRSRADLVLNTYFEEHEDTHQEVLVDFAEMGVPQEGMLVTTRLEDIAPSLNLRMHSFTLRTSIARRMKDIDEHCFYVDAEYVVYPLKYVDTVTLMDVPVYCYLLGKPDQSVSKKNSELRIGQHEHVLWSLVRFYEDETDGCKPEVRYLMLRRIREMAGTIYLIYLRMDSREACVKGIVAFDNRLRGCKEVYDACMLVPPTEAKKLIDYVLPSLRRHHFTNLGTIRFSVRTWDRLKRVRP